MKRMQLQIVLGAILVFLSGTILTLMIIEEEDRLTKYEAQQEAKEIEFGAAVYEVNCTSCHGDYAQGVPGKAPCLRCGELFTTRMNEIGWEGSLEDYIVSVVTTGRQVSTRPGLYQGEGQGPPVMPTWAQEFGGPLRDDQIRAVAAFLVSYEEWGLNPELVPTPAIAIDPDDPIALGRLEFIQQGCSGCHTVENVSQAVTGPILDGLASRAGDQVEGMSAEEYIIQSILEPNAIVVEGFNEGVMPQNFGVLIPAEGLDNLMAFLLTLEE